MKYIHTVHGHTIYSWHFDGIKEVSPVPCIVEVDWQLCCASGGGLDRLKHNCWVCCVWRWEHDTEATITGWEERRGFCCRGGLEQHNGAAEVREVEEGRMGWVWKSLLIGSSWSCGWWWWWWWGWCCCCCWCRRWWWWWCSSGTPLSHSLFSGDSDTVWSTPTTPLTPLCPCMSFWMAGQCWGWFCCCCWRVAVELCNKPTTALPPPSPTVRPPIIASCPLSEHPAKATFPPLEVTPLLEFTASS